MYGDNIIADKELKRILFLSLWFWNTSCAFDMIISSCIILYCMCIKKLQEIWGIFHTHALFYPTKMETDRGESRPPQAPDSELYECIWCIYCSEMYTLLSLVMPAVSISPSSLNSVLFRDALTFEKHSSIAFQSGEYGGK